MTFSHGRSRSRPTEESQTNLRVATPVFVIGLLLREEQLPVDFDAFQAVDPPRHEKLVVDMGPPTSVVQDVGDDLRPAHADLLEANQVGHLLDNSARGLGPLTLPEKGCGAQPGSSPTPARSPPVVRTRGRARTRARTTATSLPDFPSVVKGSGPPSECQYLHELMHVGDQLLLERLAPRACEHLIGVGTDVVRRRRQRNAARR